MKVLVCPEKSSYLYVKDIYSVKMGPLILNWPSVSPKLITKVLPYLLLIFNYEMQKSLITFYFNFYK